MMKFKDTIGFSLRLLKAKWKSNLAAFAGILLGTFLLVLFLTVSSAFEKHILTPVEENLETEILIALPRPTADATSFNPFQWLQNAGTSTIPPETVSTIATWSEVKSVSEQIQVPFPVATEAKVILGINFYFDSILSGFSEDVLQTFLPPGQTFSGGEEVIPVLISPLLIEIYNSTLTELVPQSESKVAEDFLNKELEFTFGEINYLSLLHTFPRDIPSEKRKARIVGFAPFLSPLTFAIPEKVAREMYTKFSTAASGNISPNALLITPHSQSSIPSLKEKLHQHGLFLKDPGKYVESVRVLFTGLQGVLLLSSGAIVLFSLVFLGTTLSLSIVQYTRNIGILRALGASSRTVRNIFFYQGILVSFTAVIVAFFCAQLWLSWGRRHIPDTLLQTLSRNNFLEPDIFLLGKIFAAITLSIVCMCFFISRHSKRNSPMKTILT